MPGFSPLEANEFLAEAFPAAYADGVRCAAVEVGTAVARRHFDETQLAPGRLHPWPTHLRPGRHGTLVRSLHSHRLRAHGGDKREVDPFLRPAQGDDLMARATINSTSARRLVGSIELWVDGSDEKLVAVAQGTYARP